MRTAILVFIIVVLALLLWYPGRKEYENIEKINVDSIFNVIRSRNESIDSLKVMIVKKDHVLDSMRKQKSLNFKFYETKKLALDTFDHNEHLELFTSYTD